VVALRSRVADLPGIIYFRMPTLDELRTALTAEHRQLLTRIADYHLSKGGWPLRQVIHHGFRPDGRAVAREAMDKLGGSII